MQAVKNELQAQRATWRSLMTSCKSAISDINSAEKVLKKDRETKAKQAEEKAKAEADPTRRRARRAGAPVGPGILNFEPSQGLDVFCVATPSNLKEANFAEPFLVSMNAAALLSPNGPAGERLQKILREFKHDFDVSDIKVTSGRAQLTIKDAEVCWAQCHEAW